MGRFNREYRYDMGFAVNGKPLPDTASFGATENALDTSAERDATGYLHRAMVATKHTYKMGWRNIDDSMAKYILSLIGGESFTFTCKDPFTGRVHSRKCYAGDRSYDCVWFPGGKEALADLSFNVIEY